VSLTCTFSDSAGHLATLFTLWLVPTIVENELILEQEVA
jgi:hypothetical protein